MNIENNRVYTGRLQFLPILVFVVLHSILFFSIPSPDRITQQYIFMFAGLAIFACLFASIVTFFTFTKNESLSEKINIFLSGTSSSKTMYSYFLIMALGLCNYMLARTNGVMTMVTLGLVYLPKTLVIPCLLILSAGFSMIMQSLLITIVILMPIAHGIAQSLHIDSSLMAATIMTGTLYGIHLSIYAKLPISLQNIFEKKRFVTIIAGLITIVLITQYQLEPLSDTTYQYLEQSLIVETYITIIPYFFLLLATFYKVDNVITVLTASLISFIIDILYHKTFYIYAINHIIEGLCGQRLIIAILVLHLMMACLRHTIMYTGGFEYIRTLCKLDTTKNRLHKQCLIICMTLLLNILMLYDYITIHSLISPEQELADKKKNIIKKVTTMMQVITPYSPSMLMSMSITNSSYTKIMEYMLYPLLLIIFTILTIAGLYVFTESKTTGHK